MKRPFFEVVSNKGENTGRINLYGVIGDWWEDDTTAKAFERTFRQLTDKHSRIDVFVNGPGGSVWEGLPILNTIADTNTEVHTYNVGIAFSMSGMIVLGGQPGNRHAYKGSLFMLHSASSGAWGNSKEIRKAADDLAKFDLVLAGIVADRTGKPLDEIISSYFNFEDHFLTAQEALDAGLIDSIVDAEAEKVPENIRNMNLMQVAALFDERQNEPKSYLERVMDKVRVFTSGSDNSVLNKNEDMFGNKFSKLSALAKVAAGGVTAELVDGVNAELVEQKIEGVTLVLDSELAETEDKISTLEAAAGVDKTTIGTLTAQAATDKARITALEGEVAVLKKAAGKPAEEATAPAAQGDQIPEGGAKDVEDFSTPFDKEAKAFFS